MNRRALCAILIALPAVAGCTIGNIEKQWYKASSEYTRADFERDRRACTRDRQLDEDCLRQRGWTPLSADTGPAPKPAATPKPTRY
jgi:hypothetical protein